MSCYYYTYVFLLVGLLFRLADGGQDPDNQRMDKVQKLDNKICFLNAVFCSEYQSMDKVEKMSKTSTKFGQEKEHRNRYNDQATGQNIQDSILHKAQTCCRVHTDDFYSMDTEDNYLLSNQSGRGIKSTTHLR